MYGIDIDILNATKSNPIRRKNGYYSKTQLQNIVNNINEIKGEIIVFTKRTTKIKLIQLISDFLDMQPHISEGLEDHSEINEVLEDQNDILKSTVFIVDKDDNIINTYIVDRVKLLKDIGYFKSCIIFEETASQNSVSVGEEFYIEVKDSEESVCCDMMFEYFKENKLNKSYFDYENIELLNKTLIMAEYLLYDDFFEYFAFKLFLLSSN